MSWPRLIFFLHNLQPPGNPTTVGVVSGDVTVAGAVVFTHEHDVVDGWPSGTGRDRVTFCGVLFALVVSTFM